ncbi:DUF3068 domain-containing protein [Nonomuraea sp. NPDC050556]|uniref:DUF3068 domain-containing protein n=1 Tax=Nonomuraea sp. NPDC050556 TaxID=3364369 RepID=UPI00379837D0
MKLVIDRRRAALPLIAMGAFLLTMIPMMRFVLHDQVLRLPLEQQALSRTYAKSATFLDPETLRTRTGPLVMTRWVLGDPLAGDEDTAVWVESNSLETESGRRLDYHERRVAFDRRTGAIVNCCGEYVDDDHRAVQSGQALRWPFSTEPKDYQVYDLRLRKPVPAIFDGVERVRGVDTYRFQQRTLQQRVPFGDVTSLPRRTLGLTGPGETHVWRQVEIRRTIWVEPDSGMPVKTEEQLKETLTSDDGQGQVVRLDAQLKTQEQQVANNLQAAAAYQRWILWLEIIVPIGGAVLGIACIAAGLWLSRRTSPAPQHEEQVPGDDLADAR